MKVIAAIMVVLALVIGIGCLLIGWTFGWIEIQTGSSRPNVRVARPCELTDEKPEQVD